MDTIGIGATQGTSAISNNRREVERLVDDIQEGIIKNIHEHLADADINFTGDLSYSFKKGQEGDFKTVESDNKYAIFIEFGMPPGEKIDYNALRIWVEGKLGISEGDELTQVTWNIYNQIKSHGIEQRRYFKKAILKFIGKHGKKSASRGSGRYKGSKSNFGSKLSGVIKTLKKINKSIKKSTRVISKAIKPIKKGYKKGSSGTK